MIRRPPRSARLPYTTLFRSVRQGARAGLARVRDEPPQREGDESPALGRRVLREERGLDRREQRVHRSEEHTPELQLRQYLVCRLLLEKNNVLLLPHHSSAHP